MMKQNRLLIIKDFLTTYSNRQIQLFRDFNRVKPMIYNGVGITKIHKSSKIPLNRLSNWTRKDKRYPIPYKTLLEAQKRGYFKITINSKKAEVLAYLIGWSMGDGNISKDLGKLWFYGSKEDLILLSKFVQKHFNLRPTIYPYLKMVICDTVFTRLLVALGTPYGDKTVSNYTVPKWILNGNNRIRIMFLRGFFDSELETPGFARKNSTGLRALYLYQAKTLDKVSYGIRFLSQITRLLSVFGISTSKIYRYKNYTRKRDGKTATFFYFYIHGNKKNFLKFCKIGFFLNSKRRNKTEEIKKILITTPHTK